MDQIGKVMRDFLKKARTNSVRNASALADELTKEGMQDDQIEEMLFASGFEADVVAEAMTTLPTRRPK